MCNAPENDFSEESERECLEPSSHDSLSNKTKLGVNSQENPSQSASETSNCENCVETLNSTVSNSTISSYFTADDSHFEDVDDSKSTASYESSETGKFGKRYPNNPGISGLTANVSSTNASVSASGPLDAVFPDGKALHQNTDEAKINCASTEEIDKFDEVTQRSKWQSSINSDESSALYETVTETEQASNYEEDHQFHTPHVRQSISEEELSNLGRSTEVLTSAVEPPMNDFSNGTSEEISQKNEQKYGSKQLANSNEKSFLQKTESFTEDQVTSHQLVDCPEKVSDADEKTSTCNSNKLLCGESDCCLGSIDTNLTGNIHASTPDMNDSVHQAEQDQCSSRHSSSTYPATDVTDSATSREAQISSNDGMEIDEKAQIQKHRYRSLRINVIFKYESSFANDSTEENFVAVSFFDNKTKGDVVMQHGAFKWVVFTVDNEEKNEMIKYKYSIAHKDAMLESDVMELQISGIADVEVETYGKVPSTPIYDGVHVTEYNDNEIATIHEKIKQNSVPIYSFLLINNFVSECSHQINDEYVIWWIFTWNEIRHGRVNEEGSSKMIHNSLLYIDENFDLTVEDSRAVVIFKCAIFLMMTLSENETSETWNLLFKLISFKKEDEKRIAETILLQKQERSEVHSRIKESCAGLVGNLNVSLSVDLFYVPVLWEWAELFGIKYSLNAIDKSMIATILRFSDSYYYGSNTAESLLTLAVHHGVEVYEMPNQLRKMCIVNVYKVLMRFWEEDTIKLVTLDLIGHKLLEEQTFLQDEITSCLNMSLAILRSATELFKARSKQMPHIETIYQFLTICLDLLAINDKLSESRWENKIAFLQSFRTAVKVLDLGHEQTSITFSYVSFWSDILRHRKGYTEMSRNFVDKQLKTDLQANLRSLNTDLIIKTLPSIFQEMETKGQNLVDFENFLFVFDYICILQKIPQSLTTAKEHIFLVNHRPEILKVFLFEVTRPITDTPSDTPSFDSMKTLITSEIFPTFLEVLKEKNTLCDETCAMVTKKFSEVLNQLNESSLSKNEISILQKSESVFAEYISIENIQETDAFVRCLEEQVARIKVLEEVFETLTSLLFLIDQFAACGVLFLSTGMRELLKNWTTMPLKVVSESLFPNSSTGIEAESKDCENVGEVLADDFNRNLIKKCSLLINYVIFRTVVRHQSASIKETVVITDFVRNMLPKLYEEIEKFGMRMVSGQLTVKEFREMADACESETKFKSEVLFLVHMWGKNCAKASKKQIIKLRMFQRKHLDEVRDRLRFTDSLSKLVNLLGSTDLPQLAGLSRLVRLFSKLYELAINNSRGPRLLKSTFCRQTMTKYHFQC